ncbi:MAG: hypothetical protein COW02_03390 [Comamonadaceae bacterium CG12_big_fil_rev_8_21_14_0_65_59_15]|nr:MAG: hypothetical protein COW02_03390 [Comamonadaceae bacterium CG12_big_fil_rev_8_21_14_0_65_59_15]
MTTTPTIRYNLKDRGRKHMGQERNFNVRAICDAINGPACQERVATRGMAGYYGHLPRIRHGMNPMEGVIDSGKYVPVEPAFVTTYLKADYDGNVEHRAEFLGTAAGKLAQKLFESKMGGFSTAIDTTKPEFFGMDYVIEPNFVGNSYRGVVLDSAAMTYDDVMQAEVDEQASGMIALLDSLNAERATTQAVISHLQEENEQLLSMLAKTGIPASQVLDAVAIMPIAVSMDAAERQARDAAFFRASDLPTFAAPPAAEQPRSPVYDRLLGRFNR